MQTKQAAIGDLHYSLYSQDELVDYRGLRISKKLANIDMAFRFVLDECRKRNIEILNLCGDVFHNKSVVHVDAVNLFLDACEDYPDITKVIIDGNHDMSARTESGRSAIRMIGNVPSIRRIRPPFERNDTIVYVPWNHSIRTLITQNKAKILLSHFGLNEGVLSSGISHVSDVKMSDLDNLYDLVICGHYHKPQDIVGNSCKFYYTGSLIQLDWGESGEDKRFLIFDTESCEVESIPIDCTRRYIKLDICNNNKTEVFTQFKELTEQGHKVKIFSTEKIDNIPTDIVVVDKSEKDSIDRGIDSSMSQIQKLTKYLAIENIDVDQYDTYLNFAKNILADSMKDEGATHTEYSEVVFKKIKYRNFLGTIDEFEYDFDNASLTLITGRNGIGKSTIFKALYFALYGSLPDKAVVDSIVNKKTKKDMYVCLDFDIIEGKEVKNFTLERFKKVKGKTDGAILSGPVPGNGSEEVTKIIERLVMPKKVFTNTRMFTQKVKDFFTALNDSDQKEIFRKVLSLDEYTNYYKTSDDKIKNEKSDLSTIDSEIKAKNSSIETVRSIISDINMRRSEFIAAKDKAKQECQVKIDECQSMILTIKNDNPDLYSSDYDVESSDIITEISQLKLKHQELVNTKKSEEDLLHSQSQDKISQLKLSANESFQKQSESLNVEASTLAKSYSDKLKKLQDKHTQLLESTTGHNIKITSYRSEISAARQSLKKYEDALNIEDSVCPECGQSLTSSCKDDFKVKIQTLNDLLLRTQPNLDDEITLLSLVNENISKVKEMINQINLEKSEDEKRINVRLEEIKSEIRDRLSSSLVKVNELVEIKKKEINVKYESEIRSISELIIAKNSLLENLNLNKQIKDKIEKINAQIHLIETKLKTIEESTFDDSLIVMNEQKIQTLTKEESVLQSDREVILGNIDIYTFWKKAFSPSGIPSMLIDEAIPFMNTKIKEYLDIISDSRYIVSFDTITETQKGQIKDKINVKLLDTETMNDDLNTMSGGQQRIIDIATILTFGDLQSSMQNIDFNVLVFDEIFDSLDDENSELVAKALKRLVKTNKCINVISHTHVDQIEATRTLDMNLGLFLG